MSSNVTDRLSAIEADINSAHMATITTERTCPSWESQGNDVHVDTVTLINPRIAILGEDGNSVWLDEVRMMDLVTSHHMSQDIWVKVDGSLVRFSRSSS